MTVSEDFIAGLADPDIVETLDVEAMVTAMRDDLVSRFPSIVGVIDLETEPARILIEVFAYRELLIRARVNDAARANLIAYSTGSDLDHLSGFYDVVRLADEGDDALRSRTILAIRGRSPGGTEARYEYVARSASARVAQALVYRDNMSPVVNISVLSTDNGGLADQPLIDAVSAALDASDVVMVSDTLNVHAAVKSSVSVSADVWLLPSADNAVFDGLQSKLENAWLNDGGIGRDLTLSWITKTLMQPGVQRVEIKGPMSDFVVPYNEATVINAVTLTNKGRDY